MFGATPEVPEQLVRSKGYHIAVAGIRLDL